MPEMEVDTDDAHSTYRRITCFDDPVAVKAVEHSFTELLRQLHQQATEMYLPPENVYRLNHGSNWDRPGRAGAPETTMKTLSTKWELPWQSLIDGDLGLIERSVMPITASMEQQFAEMMYGVVGEAAEKVGNVVDAKQHASLAESFIAALEKIEFGVDRDGEISMPQFHLNPDMHKRMLDELQSQPPEFSERVERIKQEKGANAMAQEADRRARFKPGGTV